MSARVSALSAASASVALAALASAVACSSGGSSVSSGGADDGPPPGEEDAASSRDSAAPSSPGDGAPSGTDASDAGAGSSTTLHFASSAYTLYASVGGGTAHLVQLDTGSLGLFVPKSVLGASATVSATETCSITYVSSGNVLSGHQATAPITLLGSTAAGDVASPPTTITMPFCAVDDTTFTGGVMGVGFGRGTAPSPAWNVLLEVQGVHVGYVLGTQPTPWVQIGLTTAGSMGFQMLPLTPGTYADGGSDGDWVATSLRGCLALPSTPAFAEECGPLLVDTGIPETLLWGPSDPTLGGVVPSGQTTVPSGTSIQIATPADAGILDYSFVLGTGADTPSEVDLRTATAFSINTGRALLEDYDYLFDADSGLVGFRKN